MSPRLPSVSSNQILAALKKAGFFIHHQTGSHIILKSQHASVPRVIVPANRKDLKKGTLKSILKQAELSVEEFIELLRE